MPFLHYRTAGLARIANRGPRFPRQPVIGQHPSAHSFRRRGEAEERPGRSRSTPQTGQGRQHGDDRADKFIEPSSGWAERRRTSLARLGHSHFARQPCCCHPFFCLLFFFIVIDSQLAESSSFGSVMTIEKYDGLSYFLDPFYLHNHVIVKFLSFFFYYLVAAKFLKCP